MTDTQAWTIEEVDETIPPPFFHEAMEKVAGRITSVEQTEHDQYGAGFRFHFHMTGDDTANTVWYTTGTTKSAKNKLGKLGMALYGTLDAMPTDVRDFVGLGINVMFEHTPPAKAGDGWTEKILAVSSRKLSKGEQNEDIAKHELAAKEAPF